MFGTPKNGTLKINNLPSNNGISHMNERLTKWRQRFVKNGFERTRFFVQKLNFFTFPTLRFDTNFASM